jgi:DNA invertase Pin-like site-specific DNA recombinase
MSMTDLAPDGVALAAVNGSGTLPLAFGYMRVAEDSCDDQVAAQEKAVKDYALIQRWALEAFFTDWRAGSYEQYGPMLMEAWARKVRHVIVPSNDHLAANDILRGLLVAQAHDNGILVRTASATGGDPA